jgi:hypothetical protein
MSNHKPLADELLEVLALVTKTQSALLLDQTLVSSKAVTESCARLREAGNRLRDLVKAERDRLKEL